MGSATRSRGSRIWSAPSARVRQRTRHGISFSSRSMSTRSAEARALADRLRGAVGGFKIGSRLFTSRRAGVRRGARRARRSRVPRPEVPRHPEHRRRRGRRRHAARRLDGQRARVGRPRDDAAPRATPPTRKPRADRGRAARHRRDDAHQPDQAALAEIGVTATVAGQVERLAALTEAAGLDGVVASPQEIAIIRRRCGPRFTIVTPGIRGAGDAQGRSEPDAERRRRARRRRELPGGRPADHRGRRSARGRRAHRRRVPRPGHRDRPHALLPPRLSSVRRDEGGGPARDARPMMRRSRSRRSTSRPTRRSRRATVSEIPVLLVDGKKAAKYRVTEDELTRLLARARQMADG